MTPEQVTAHILARSAMRFSRSSGPGGQHRDHSETRAELTIDAAALAGLPDALAARLGARLNLTRRPLRLASQADRSRERNRATVERSPANQIAGAPRPHRARPPTRPSASSIARRLDQKAHRSRTKALRRTAGDD